MTKNLGSLHACGRRYRVSKLEKILNDWDMSTFIDQPRGQMLTVFDDFDVVRQLYPLVRLESYLTFQEESWDSNR